MDADPPAGVTLPPERGDKTLYGKQVAVTGVPSTPIGSSDLRRSFPMSWPRHRDDLDSIQIGLRALDRVVGPVICRRP